MPSIMNAARRAHRAANPPPRRERVEAIHAAVAEELRRREHARRLAAMSPVMRAYL